MTKLTHISIYQNRSIPFARMRVIFVKFLKAIDGVGHAILHHPKHLARIRCVFGVKSCNFLNLTITRFGIMWACWTNWCLLHCIRIEFPPIFVQFWSSVRSCIKQIGKWEHSYSKARSLKLWFAISLFFIMNIPIIANLSAKALHTLCLAHLLVHNTSYITPDTRLYYSIHKASPMSMLERIIGHWCLQVFVDIVQTQRQLANWEKWMWENTWPIQSVLWLHIPKIHWLPPQCPCGGKTNSTSMFTSISLHKLYYPHLSSSLLLFSLQLSVAALYFKGLRLSFKLHPSFVDFTWLVLLDC